MFRALFSSSTLLSRGSSSSTATKWPKPSSRAIHLSILPASTSRFSSAASTAVVVSRKTSNPSSVLLPNLIPASLLVPLFVREFPARSLHTSRAGSFSSFSSASTSFAISAPYSTFETTSISTSTLSSQVTLQSKPVSLYTHPFTSVASPDLPRGLTVESSNDNRSSYATSTSDTVTQDSPSIFQPRTTFPVPSSLPRSYFLGHHKAGLDKMKTLVSQIDLVIECRDYRVPITGRNPEFERTLGLGLSGGKRRIVVYTKYDLGVGTPGPRALREIKRKDDLLREFHAPEPVYFSQSLAEDKSKMVGKARKAGKSGNRLMAKSKEFGEGTIRTLLRQIKTFARNNFSLTGHTILVAGMPNVGKSTLLNALRKEGVPAEHRSTKKVAKTGADPGVTRSIGSAVRILEREQVEVQDDGADGTTTRSQGPSGVPKEASTEAVYLLDTPGVFMPYVPDAISMLKLALCGAVKDTILPPVTVADYLLFEINRHKLERVYSEFTADRPTNNIIELLEGMARRTGKLGKKGTLDTEAAALWFVKRWRQGRLGKFQLDDVNEDSLKTGGEGRGAISWSQAVKLDKERRRERTREANAGE